MKYLAATLCFLSLTAFARPQYEVDENHIPPQEQQARDMDRPTPSEIDRKPQSDENATTYGSKVGPNPEAADKKPSPKDKLHD